MHNGAINGFPEYQRAVLAIDPTLFDGIAGSTDSETLFYLGSRSGSRTIRSTPSRRRSGSSRRRARHGVEYPMQGTLGISNGERLWAIRYSSEHQVAHAVSCPRTATTVQGLYPDNPRSSASRRRGPAHRVRAAVRPPRDVERRAESTALVIQPGADQQLPFEPRMPALRSPPDGIRAPSSSPSDEGHQTIALQRGAALRRRPSAPDFMSAVTAA